MHTVCRHCTGAVWVMYIRLHINTEKRFIGMLNLSLWINFQFLGYPFIKCDDFFINIFWLYRLIIKYVSGITLSILLIYFCFFFYSHLYFDKTKKQTGKHYLMELLKRKCCFKIFDFNMCMIITCLLVRVNTCGVRQSQRKSHENYHNRTRCKWFAATISWKTLHQWNGWGNFSSIYDNAGPENMLKKQYNISFSRTPHNICFSYLTWKDIKVN